MKTTLHYLLTILLLSLTTVYARAAEGDEGPFKISDIKENVHYEYNENKTLLTISGSGSLTITGDGKPVDCGIVIEPTGLVTMTMKDVYLQSEIPLKGGGDPDGENLKIILQGINKLKSTATDAKPGMLLTGDIDIFGNGSLTSKGSDSGGAGIDTKNGELFITENAFIIAIGGKGAQTGVTNFNNYVDAISEQNSLLISGVEQSDNNIKQDYSDLNGNFTFGVDAEIPEWASVNVARNQTLTIANDVTLINSGAIINTGTINGIPAGNPVNTIGGENGFTIESYQSVGLEYDSGKKLLTISGGGNLTIKGKGKSVDCGIVIATDMLAIVKMEDLYLESEIPLTAQNVENAQYPKIILQGINRLESNAVEKQPGMSLKGDVDISGPGSLTVKGSESGGAGIDRKECLSLLKNAFVVAIGGKGASGVEDNDNPIDIDGDNALLISGSLQEDGTSIQQNYSKLIGNFTLGVNAEIPAWASVNVARNQTLTIANDVTLTNSGTIINTGTINGTPAGNPVNTIGGKDGFTINSDPDVTLNYDSGKKLLTIGGSGDITITGKGELVDCGIEREDNSSASLTIENLYLQSEVPLKMGKNTPPSASEIFLKGTNILKSTASDSQAGMSLGEPTTISGPGSLMVKGSESGGAGIAHKGLTFQKEAFVVAIGGKGVSGVKDNDIDGDNALLISGLLQEGGTNIQQNYSKLIGNFTLNTNIEIPAWATVTIPTGQSITITENGTLTNQGTLTLEDNSTLTNQGTLILGENATFNKGNGTFTNANESIIRIGGEKGFNITKVDPGVIWSYDKVNKLFTLDGTGSITLTGEGEPVDCGIAMKSDAKIELTLENVFIQSENPFEVGGTENGEILTISLKGINRLESTATGFKPGMSLNRSVNIKGGGSLRVKGSASGGSGISCDRLIIENAVFWAEGIGTGAYGIMCDDKYTLEIKENAFVVAFSGNNGISLNEDSIKHESGLLICSVLEDGVLGQNTDITDLKGDITLGVDAEIPEWASISVNKGNKFTISDNVTLTNYGTLSNHGTIEIKEKGKIEGNPPEHFVEFKYNYNSPASAGGGYIKHGSEPIFEEFYPREGYTFEGWYDAPNGGRKVTAVTNPMTVYAHWTNNNPPPPPPPTVYYTVTLPVVEGAVTNPVAGTYLVESWGSFRFYLTIDTAYSESQPVVTTSRNETLTPQALDGAYVVEGVSTDMEIFIDGLVKNPPPVANESILTGDLPKIWVEHSCLCIRTPESAGTVPIRILTPSGHLLYSFGSVPGLTRRQLPTGIYIVRVGDTVEKVFVR